MGFEGPAYCFRAILSYLQVFAGILRYSQVFSVICRYSQLFPVFSVICRYLELFPVFSGIPRYSQVFPGILSYLQVFSVIPGILSYLQVFRAIPSCFRLFFSSCLFFESLYTSFMGTKLLVIDNMTQQKEREAYSDKDLSKASLSEMFFEFGILFEEDAYYLNKYLNCYVLREKEGYLSYKIDFLL